MMRLGKQTQIIGLIALLYIGGAGCMLAWVLYEVSVSGSALTAQANAIADRNARAQVYQELSKTIDNTALERQTLTGYVLTEDQTSEFLTNIENLGTAEGVTLTTDSLNVVRQDKSIVDQLVIDFSISGDPVAVQQVLKLFENLPYNSQVTTFSSQRVSSSQTTSKVELTVSLLKHVQ